MAEELLFKAPHDHEYAPIEGIPEFVKLATALAYGDDAEVIRSNRVAALQALSGTGSLRLIAGFIARFLKRAEGDNSIQVRVSNPTWGNHYQIFGDAGLTVGPYRYWDQAQKGLDFKGMCEDFRAMTPHTIVILHACAHNPTGVDPTMEQWAVLSQICLEKKLFVVFDAAYQGFASGDPDVDIGAVRLFVKDGHNLALCQSFAKNFGLYGERVGNLSLICKDSDEKDRAFSQIKIVARSLWSNPAVNGAKIVAKILSTPELRKQWYIDIQEMSGRIIKMRSLLKEKLIERGSELNWDHITQQIGMFSYTGLSKEQSQRLTDDFHIYLTLNGRISMCGLTTANIDRFAAAVHEVSKDSETL